MPRPPTQVRRPWRAMTTMVVAVIACWLTLIVTR